MSVKRAKGTRVWIFAFISFLAGVNVFNAVMLQSLWGSDFVVEFSIMDLKLGYINVVVYFLVSTITMLLLLGLTFFFIFQGFPVDANVLQRLSKLESNLALNAKMLENMQMGFFRRLENNEKAADEALQKMNKRLDETMKETTDAIEKQSQTLKDAEKENQKNTDIIKKQASEVTNVKHHVVKLEKALSPAKTKLTSKSKLKALKGLRPRLTKELKSMGITNVGQFLTTDPSVIAQNTSELHEAVTNLQAQAQLLMVPGVDNNDAELLVKAGVTSRKELADQDPVQLCRAISNIANDYLENGKMSASRIPTVDDVWSWIRSAKP